MVIILFYLQTQQLVLTSYFWCTAKNVRLGVEFIPSIKIKMTFFLSCFTFPVQFLVFFVSFFAWNHCCYFFINDFTFSCLRCCCISFCLCVCIVCFVFGSCCFNIAIIIVLVIVMLLSIFFISLLVCPWQWLRKGIIPLTQPNIPVWACSVSWLRTCSYLFQKRII